MVGNLLSLAGIFDPVADNYLFGLAVCLCNYVNGLGLAESVRLLSGFAVSLLLGFLSGGNSACALGACRIRSNCDTAAQNRKAHYRGERS